MDRGLERRGKVTGIRAVMAFMRQPKIKERITAVAFWDMEVLEDIIDKIFSTNNPDWDFPGWKPLTQPPVLPKDLFEDGEQVEYLDVGRLLELFSIDSDSETVSSTEAASSSAAEPEPAEPEAASSPMSNSDVLQGSSDLASKGQASLGPNPEDHKPEAELDPEADPESEAEPKPEVELKPEAESHTKMELDPEANSKSEAKPDHPADTEIDAGHNSESSNSYAAENDLTGASHSPTAVTPSKPPIGPLQLLALPNSLVDVTDNHAE
ncbi:hypothetical protein GE09DRAFT_1280344 [Coniochaeta sp. 2T2.1]|nr:hypothetical protein GE09DRAFT_1280344 [Coniochaeta sp. 2T2.1]